MSYVKVALVGAGPGDPGLLTIRGRDLLESADLVVYDRLVDDDILRHARPDAELIDVGKLPGEGGRRQAEINELLVAEARAAGADHVQLTVVDGNDAAHRLYRGLGFEPYGRVRTLVFA